MSSYKESFSLYLTNAEEIIHIVNELNNKTSCGYNEIPLNIVKASITPIAGIISALINNSFSTGHFPSELKIARVCPIFKDGCKKTLSNYRPISLLPSFSKIYEKAMYKRLQRYLDSKKILIKNQYGFRTKHSSYMAILDMCDNISKSFDNGEFSVGIFIDLQKAFNTLNHEILLAKLRHYGIRGITLQ